MKKLLSITIVLLCTSTVFTQGQNWKISGNTISPGDYLGTNNNEPLIFKANGNEGLRIKPNGDLRIKGFDDNTFTGLVFVNSNGVLSKLNFTGNSNDVLLGNGTFGTVGNLTGWFFSGTNIYSNYNVGIGTNITPEKLTVNGNILANGSISGTSLNVVDIVGAGKEFKISTSLCMKGIDVNDPNSRNELCGMNGDLFIQSEHNNPYSTVFGLGNGSKTGFGVIPTEKFHVGTDAKFDGGLNFSNLSVNPNVTEILIIDPSGKISRSGDILPLATSVYTVECRTDNNGNITPFWRNGPWKTYIGGTVCEENIKVGINMVNPVANLHVVGNGYLSKELGIGILPDLTSMVTISSTTDGQTGLTVVSTSSTSDDYGVKSVIDNDATKGFALHDSRINQDVFRVLGNGEVQAKSVKVSLNIWSDFVFEDGYKLMPLNELETYIVNNNHLPNIPSEQEVITNGIDLGQMDAKLLQKIEELSLYIIEQQKQLDELKTELQKLTDK